MNNLQININILEYKDITEFKNIYQDLINSARNTVFFAYAPYSKFKVGAAVLLENGEIITGTNQENSAYPSGMCAERVAIFYANSKFPNIPVKALAVCAYHNEKYLKIPTPPCGSCRQVILETEVRFKKPIDIILYGTDKILVFKSAKDMLPLSFSEDFLK
ncbi:MAG: cytidine deaminase [Bacteroidales bacterium]|nr:cytidine deaminase [Bacteroidales bacterium]